MPHSNAPEQQNAELAASPYAMVNASVYVIDDDVEMRRSLHALLSTVGVISWSFASASEFLGNLNSLDPAPILLDIRMSEIDGLQLMDLLVERGLGWPIIVMTAHGEIPIAVRALKLGAIEFLEKPFGFDALHTAMQLAFQNMAAFNKKNSIRFEARRRFALLSRRETEVIQILMKGIPNKVAAYTLSLSPRTVEMHRARALVKLHVKSLAEVVHLSTEAEFAPSGLTRDNDNVPA